jgi:hypothetical protein
MNLNMYNFDGQQLTEGLSMSLVSQLLLAAAKDNPRATLEDLPWDCVVGWSAMAGPGTATLLHADGTSSIRKMTGRKRNEPITLMVGDTLQVQPKNGQSWTLSVGPGGLAATTQGLVDHVLVESEPHAGDTPDQLAVRRWLATGKDGLSSRTLASFLLGVPTVSPGDYAAPRDPADFRRCLELMEFAPVVRERLPELAALPQWKAIATHWEELEGLYHADLAVDPKRAPTLYARLDELNQKASSVRRPAKGP